MKMTGVALMLNISVPLNERLLKQADRLSSSKTMIIRMALTKYLEELESSEPEGRSGKAKLSRGV